MKNRYLISVFFSLVAFFVASYLTILHFQESIPPCTFSGCEVVLTSRYAEIMGIPVSLIGAIFYGLVLTLSLSLLTNFKTSILKFYLLMTTAGLLASGYFLFLQVAVIKEFCQYCLITEVCTLILFFIGITDSKKLKINKDKEEN